MGKHGKKTPAVETTAPRVPKSVPPKPASVATTSKTPAMPPPKAPATTKTSKAAAPAAAAFRPGVTKAKHVALVHADLSATAAAPLRVPVPKASKAKMSMPPPPAPVKAHHPPALPASSAKSVPAIQSGTELFYYIFPWISFQKQRLSVFRNAYFIHICAFRCICVLLRW